jgi:hypothetical protein
VWDELGKVVGLHEQVAGVRYWEILGWNEQRTKEWVQLMPQVKWEPEHSLFHRLESEAGEVPRARRTTSQFADAVCGVDHPRKDHAHLTEVPLGDSLTERFER